MSFGEFGFVIYLKVCAVYAVRAPKVNSCATSCGTSPATPSAAPCAASLTCSSFMYRPRKAWGAVENDACHDEHLYAFPSSAAPDTSSVTSCVNSSATSCAAPFTCSSLT